MSVKRAAEEDILTAQRYTRIRLASPSPTRSSSSDTESIHSCQGYETEFVKDTSDTSSSPAYNIEFEITEDNDKKKERYYFTDETDESEVAVIADLDSDVGSVTCDSLDLALLGDTSEENSTSPTSNSDVDPELPRNDYLDFEKCLLCQTDKKDISYPYCSTCFTWKKNLFPSRPKKHQKNIKKQHTSSILDLNPSRIGTINIEDGSITNTEQNTSSIEGVNTRGESSSSQGYYDDSGMGSSGPQLPEDVAVETIGNPSTAEPSTSNSRKLTLDMCRVCFVKPENGLFVHINIAHVYGCYTCAKKIWYHSGGCPICRRKIFKVAKLFV